MALGTPLRLPLLHVRVHVRGWFTNTEIKCIDLRRTRNVAIKSASIFTVRTFTRPVAWPPAPPALTLSGTARTARDAVTSAVSVSQRRYRISGRYVSTVAPTGRTKADDSSREDTAAKPPVRPGRLPSTTAVADALDYLSDVEVRVLRSNDATPITHVAHISDIHIRRSDRFEEYNHVFQRLYEELRELRRLHPGSIVVIAGDVVHDKCNLHSNGMDATWSFFKNLSGIMPVVAIPGNHDGQVRNASAKNTLYALLRDREHTYPIHLLLSSGAYKYNNIIFGVSSIFDGKFVKAKTIAGREEGNTVKVALYHGAVGRGTSTNSGYILQHVIRTQVFRGYDLVLLGDIHKHQYLNPGRTIAYPGSLISQDFGEGDDDHGWIEWDLATCKPTYHRLPNDYAHKSIDFIKGKVMYSGIEYDAESIVKVLPKKAHLRIMYNDDLVAVNTFERFLLDSLPGLTVKKIPMLPETIVQSLPLLNLSRPGDLLNDQNLSSFIAKSYPTLSPEEVMETMKALVKEMSTTEDNGEYEAADWTPLVLKFSHLYGYGSDNVIDFTRLRDHGVVGLFAPNAYGKSSVLDILSIAMFGKTTSEGTLHPTIVNETQKGFDTSLYFRAKGDIYRVVRKGTKSKMSQTCELHHLVSKEQALHLVDEAAAYTEVFLGEEYYATIKSRGVSDTQKAVSKLVGSYDGFRLTSMCLQNSASLNSFISMPNVARKRMLLKLFNLDVFEKMHAILKPKLTTTEGTFDWLEKSLLSLGNPDMVQSEYHTQLAVVTNRLESIESQMKMLEIGTAVARASRRKVTLSEADIKEQLSAILNTDALMIETEAIREDLGALENQEAELQRKVDGLVLVGEKEAILKAHEQFEISKRARLEKLQRNEDDMRSWMKPLYEMSYDCFKHEAILKEFEELKQELQATPANIKDLMFSDTCDCCKHNRSILGQKETGTVMKYNMVKEQVEKMESNKKLFEDNQKIREHNKQLQEKLHEMWREKKSVIEEKDGRYEMWDQQNNEHAELTAKLLAVSMKRNKLISDYCKLEIGMAEEKKKHDELQQMLADIDHNLRVDSLVEEQRRELAKLYVEKQQLVKNHTNLIGKIATVEKDVKLYHSHKQEYDKLSEEKAMYERLEHITSPNGYSLHMLQHYIPQICQGVNSVISMYMDRDVDMRLEGDTISLMSVPRDMEGSPGCSIPSFSGMERFMVDVAIKIVLGKMARVPHSGMMFIDEGMSVLDQDRMARIGDLFQFLRKHFHYTFIISHIDAVESSVDMRLYITKEGRFSKINNTESWQAFHSQFSPDQY